MGFLLDGRGGEREPGMALAAYIDYEFTTVEIDASYMGLCVPPAWLVLWVVLRRGVGLPALRRTRRENWRGSVRICSHRGSHDQDSTTLDISQHGRSRRSSQCSPRRKKAETPAEEGV